MNLFKSENTKLVSRNVVIRIMVVINVCNFLLVTLKGVAAYLTKGFSLSTSAIESFGDVFVGALMLIQTWIDKRIDKSHYPRGKSADASVNLVASVVMMTLASVNFLISFDSLVRRTINPEYNTVHISIILVNIISKVLLLLMCISKRDNNRIKVLMLDQWTDVKTNSIALISVCLAHYVQKEIDFVGATVIFLLIIKNWQSVVRSSWFKLQGVRGKEELNDSIKQAIEKNADLVDKFSGFFTYHIGYRVITEVFADFGSVDKQIRFEKAIDSIECVHKCYVFPTDHNVVKIELIRLENEQKEGDGINLV